MIDGLSGEYGRDLWQLQTTQYGGATLGKSTESLLNLKGGVQFCCWRFGDALKEGTGV